MLEALIEDLSRDDAYPHSVDGVEVHQTHISVVFLAGEFAYKLKKPLDLGFVDYSTQARRRHFCEREVRLNERLAPDIYLDTVPVVCGEEGHRIELSEEGEVGAEIAEWAVRMRRLQDSNTLRSRLADDRVPQGIFERVGRRIARFHEEAKGGADVNACATFEVVEKNALDNFEQAREHVGHTVRSEVFGRLEALTREHLKRLAPLISRRAESGRARDTHGDLRLEHIYIDDEGSLRIVDCIEFNDALRYADPVCDIAFLLMDLGFRGYDDEARLVREAYFEQTDDDEGRRLVDFYVAYRSCVRAKVHGFKCRAEEVPEDKRRIAEQKARAHWLYALWRLEEEGRGPSLVLLGGLPAAGKSTLGRRLVKEGRAELLIESDVVRKELAGIDPAESGRADFGAGIYTEEFSRRTYAEVARRAEEALRRGKGVAVAATFVSDERRREFIDMARKMGVPVRFVECRISEEESLKRLRARTDDVSDADIAVYENLKEAWEPPSPAVERVHEVRDTSSD